jgi:hypothetical protein
VGGLLAVLLLLLLSFNLVPIYAVTRETITDIKLIHVSDVYEFTKKYYTEKKTKEILGVKVTAELDVPIILINNEESTFTYRVKVDNAPSEWRLNITEAVIKAFFCIDRSVQKPATVLRGGGSLTRQLTVKTSREELSPGFYTNCNIEFQINYRAEFGANKENGYILLSPWSLIRSRELPLELKPNISAKPTYVKLYLTEDLALEFNGEIRIRNVQNWEIVLSRLRLCSFSWTFLGDFAFGPSCGDGRDLASTVIRPGEETTINVNEHIRALSLMRFRREDFARDIVFIIEYVTPNGKAQNWVLYQVSGRITKVTEKTESPTKGVTTRTPTETRTTATIGTTRAETPGPVVVTITGPAATGSSTDAFTLALILVPIAVAAATATVFAIRWLRKAPT